MMRIKFIIYLLVFLLVIAGCSTNSDNSDTPRVAGDVQEVKLSRSLGFGSVNEALFGTFTEQFGAQTFVDAIESAVKVDGILDIRRPDYDVIVHSNESDYSIHLWLDTDIDTGMFTYVTDTGTGYTINEQAASSLKKLIMSITYTPEQAEENGDLVNVHGTYKNLKNWNSFVAQLQNGTEARIQITTYTIEGDPIFDNLSFDGQTIEYTHDTTMDAFGNAVRTTSFCEGIESSNTNTGIEYSLTGCGNENVTLFVIPSET